jgi:hypothetical protein
MLLRSSWLPLAGVLGLTILYVVVFSAAVLYLHLFNFSSVRNYSVSLFSSENKYLTLLVFIFFTSLFIFNRQELTSAKGIVSALSYVAFFYVFFLLLPGFVTKNKLYFRKLISTVSNAGFILAVIGLVLLFMGMNPIPEYKTNLLSIITHPNNSSIIFTITVPVTLYYFFWQKEKLSFPYKLFYSFSAFIQVVAQLFTYTRAGIIATIIGIVIFISIIYKNKVIVVLPIVFVGLSSTLVGFLSAKGFDSFLSRFLLLIPAYNMITNNTTNLLWGYGINNASEVYKDYQVTFNIIEEKIDDPHNSYFYLVMMFGAVFTIIVLFWILKTLFKGAYLTFKRTDNKFKLFLAFLISVTFSLLIQALFDSELVKSEYYSMQIFLFFLGLLHIYVYKRNGYKNQIYA